MPLDIPPPPKLWAPPRPAIIRARRREDIGRALRLASFLPGMFPAGGALSGFAPPAGTATVSRTGGRSSAADASTYNYNTAGGTAVPIGADGVDHMLRIAVGGRSLSADITITAITIDGVNILANQVGTTVNANPGNALDSLVGMLSLRRTDLPDPTQTDVDVSVTFSANLSRCFVEMFVTVGAEFDELDFAGDGDPANPGTPTLVLNCDTVAGGVGIGVALGNQGGGTTITWGGTEVTAQAAVDFENSTVRSAIISNGTAETNRSITAGVSSTFQPSALFATWAPV